MKRLIYGRTLIFTMAVWAGLLLPNTVQAGNTGADFLVKTAKAHLQSGDVTSALHEFSKALMLDPDHQEAKYYLSQYGVPSGLYKNVETRTSQIADMGKSIKIHNDQIVVLEQQKQELEHKIQDLAMERDMLYHSNMINEARVNDLSSEIEQLRSEMYGQDFEHAQQIHDLGKGGVQMDPYYGFEHKTEADIFEEQIAELKELRKRVRHLIIERDELQVANEHKTNQISSLRKEMQVQQFDNAKKFEKEIISMPQAQEVEVKDKFARIPTPQPVMDVDHGETNQHMEELNIKLNDVLTEAESKEDALRQVTYEYNQLKNYVHDRYAHQEKLIAVLEDYLRLREDHLNLTSDEVIEKHIGMTQKEKILISRLGELIDMYDSTGTYQGLIQSKDQLIDNKIKDVERLQQELNKADKKLDSRDKQLELQTSHFMQLEKEFIETKDQLNDQFDQRQQFIEELKSEIDKSK